MRSLVLGVLLLTIPSLGEAQQRIRVGVSVSDSLGSLSSVVRSALRSIPDVLVVSASEDADLRISMVSICVDDDRCPSRAVSAVVTKPIGKGYVDAVVQPEHRRFLYNYEEIHGHWIFIWGENRYEQASRRFIQGLDGACLEGIRTIRRALDMRAAGDTAGSNRMLAAERPAQLRSDYSCG